jgi:hypothetical protein
MDLLIPALAIAFVYLFLSLRVVRQYERGVAFFLGRYWGTKGPGLIFLPAVFAGQKRVSLRIVAMDIPPQDVITRDNVSVKVNAVLYMRVSDPAKAIIEIEDYLYATSQLAQTTLRSVLGEVERPRGFILATGFSGHGFAMGPIAGRLVAELIVDGKTSLDIAPFRFSRFAEGAIGRPRNVL